MKILDYKLINKGCLLGVATISLSANLYKKQVSQIIIRDICVFQKNGQRWISFPGREYEKDGKKKTWANISIPQADDLKQMQQEFFEELASFAQKQPQHQTKQVEENTYGDVPF